MDRLSGPAEKHSCSLGSEYLTKRLTLDLDAVRHSAAQIEVYLEVDGWSRLVSL
jgi:hypothetical protein